MGRPLLTLAAIRPQANAVVPLTFRYVPGATGAGLTSYVWAKTSVVSPKLYPARKAARFPALISSDLATFASIHFSVTSVGRPYIQETSPRAKKFFARSASFLVMLMPSVARSVIDVMGTWYSWY